MPLFEANKAAPFDSLFSGFNGLIIRTLIIPVSPLAVSASYIRFTPVKLTRLDPRCCHQNSTLQINANVIPSITGTVFRGPIHLGSLRKGDKFLDQFDLADTLPHQRESSTIDILVGNDYYLDLLLSRRVEVQPGLYHLES